MTSRASTPHPDSSVTAPRPFWCIASTATLSFPALCYNLPEAPAATERNPQYAADLRAVLEALDFPPEYVAAIA